MNTTNGFMLRRTEGIILYEKENCGKFFRKQYEKNFINKPNNYMKPINVLSLFGGIECGRVALEKLGVPVENYFSSEIDPYAMEITKKNYPEIIHIG